MNLSSVNLILVHANNKGADHQPRLQHTVMILSFWTERFRQIVQTQIRLLLEEQSDQFLHCLPFNLHFLDKKPFGLVTFLILGRLQQCFIASENLGTLL